jgi:hypothetical protein
MILSVTEQEKSYLLELLESAHTSLLHELHHTDTADYKEMLRERVELVEKLRRKMVSVMEAE